MTIFDQDSLRTEIYQIQKIKKNQGVLNNQIKMKVCKLK